MLAVRQAHGPEYVEGLHRRGKNSPFGLKPFALRTVSLPWACRRVSQRAVR